MLPYTLIEKKANGAELNPEEIRFFVEGYTRGELPDYQMSALLMAIFHHGMSAAETLELTRVMLESGRQMDFSDLPGFVADKHSTGGVGDKTSLIIAPVLAELGIHVPMISGRGLGHTGGTLDKLESIPGFNVNQSLENFDRLVRLEGAGLVGQTGDIAPADRKLYALRDVTATVRSIPLITASIMSKKIAEGIRGLVLDVKTGNGAFMESLDEARSLARNLVEVGERYGIRTTALLTDMNQPLGNAIGNWVEVRECIDVLRGEGPSDLRELCLALGAEILQMRDARLAPADAVSQQSEVLANGKALKRFMRLVKAHGGDEGVIREPEQMPRAAQQHVVPAPASGYVSGFATKQFGLAGITLRAGRRVIEDRIDHQAGILLHAKLGERVEAGQPLYTLLAEDERVLQAAARELELSVQINEQAPMIPPLVYETISKYYFFGQRQ